MTPIEMLYQIMQDQGVVAGLLVLLLWQNNSLQQQLIKKNCELNSFLMECYGKQMDHELDVAEDLLRADKMRRDKCP